MSCRKIIFPALHLFAFTGADYQVRILYANRFVQSLSELDGNYSSATEKAALNPCPG